MKPSTLIIILLSFLCSVLSNDACEKIGLSENGSDVPSCFESNCKSLDYVVRNFNRTDPSCVLITMNDNQTLSINWNVTTGNFTMRGMGFVTITCSSGVGMIFNKSSEVLISGIELINCGITKGEIQAAMIVHDCKHLNVSNSAFVNSTTTGLLVMDSSQATNVYKNSSRQYFISNTTFINNRDYHSSYQFQNSSAKLQEAKLGSGLKFDLIGTGKTDMVMNNCSFLNNDGFIGGGAYINTNSFATFTRVTMQDCKFIGNRAVKLGGGLYIGTTTNSSEKNPETINLDIYMNRVLFLNNTSPHAGGFAYQMKGQQSMNVMNATVNINNVKFTSNAATFSGGAVGMFKWEAELGGVTHVVNFCNCSWTSNSMTHQTYTDNLNSTFDGIGILYTHGIPFNLKGDTLINHSHGTAILAISAEVYMWDQIIISSNRGVRGGAVSFLDGARMVVQKGLNLTFAHNYADLVGGAVYHVVPVMGVSGLNQYCVFMYYQRSITDPSEWEANIWFIDNNALVSGLSVYLSGPDSCKGNNKGKIFTENNTFHFIPSYVNQITTSPVQVTIISPSIDCSVRGSCWIEVMLGEKMRVMLNATDAFGNNVKGFAAVDINCVQENGTLLPNELCDYRLEGTNLVEFQNGLLQQVPFYIAGNRQSEYKDNVLLTWQLIEQPSTVGYLHIRIKDCYLGYIYNKTTQSCVCYNKEESVVCRDDYTACVRFGHWFGKFKGNDTSGASGDEQFTVTECPFGSCDYTVSGKCPNGTEQCGSDGSSYQFYCELPSDNPNALCLFNKGGVMCSSCKDNHSPSFPSLRCVPDEQCNPGYAVVQAILYALYLFGAVFLVLLVAKFDLRIGSGQIYCLVFYFSVFKYFVGGVFPSQFLNAVEIFFTGLVQFDPAIFGLIPLCSGIKINRFLEAFLQLINPTTLILAIVLILYVSWKWPKYAFLQNTMTGINAVCVMLYLCFISITQTSLTLLTPIKFPDIDGVYTFLNPTVKYFSLPHLGYGIIALLLQVLFVIPFLCLLLFSPFLIRFSRLNLTKIKPILDEFQACYKTEYRYFAGYYLTCRQLIFLISFINLGAFAYIYILQFLSIFLLTTHLMVQPYKEKYLNILDGLLILDLVVLSLLHGNTAAIVFDEVVQLKIAFIYILVLLPAMYFVYLCVYPIIQFCFPRLKKLSFNKTNGKFQKIEFTASTHTCVGTTVVSLDNSLVLNESGTIIKNADDAVLVENMEREPLLFMDSFSSDYEDSDNVVMKSTSEDAVNNTASIRSRPPSKGTVELQDAAKGYTY